jgi:hypothetical protein
VQASLFVATLGASNYTFAAAFENRKLPSWIEAHIQAWEFFDGVATLTIPDNEKTGVEQACAMNPGSIAVMANWPNITVRLFSDTGKKAAGQGQGESAVLHAQRRILAVLRIEPFSAWGN